MTWLPVNVLRETQVKNEVPSHLLRLPLYASLSLASLGAQTVKNMPAVQETWV